MNNIGGGLGFRRFSLDDAGREKWIARGSGGGRNRENGFGNGRRRGGRRFRGGGGTCRYTQCRNGTETQYDGNGTRGFHLELAGATTPEATSETISIRKVNFSLASTGPE